MYMGMGKYFREMEKKTELWIAALEFWTLNKYKFIVLI